MRDLRVAAGMMRAVVGDKAGNLERTRQLASLAARHGAEVMILPEACLTGYTVRESMSHLAESVPGPLTETLGDIAGEFDQVILAGLIEKDRQGACFLTQVMVGPQGLLGAYRKTHLGPTEMTLFTPGKHMAIIDCKGIRFGVQLCYEGHFPEITLAQALQGVEVVLIPHASPREEPDQKLERWLRYLPARAYDNTVFVVACNQAGDNGAGLDFSGVALVLGPKGQVLAQATGTEDALVTADLKAAQIQSIKEGRMGYFLPLRRPDLYDIQ